MPGHDPRSAGPLRISQPRYQFPQRDSPMLLSSELYKYRTQRGATHVLIISKRRMSTVEYSYQSIIQKPPLQKLWQLPNWPLLHKSKPTIVIAANTNSGEGSMIDRSRRLARVAVARLFIRCARPFKNRRSFKDPGQTLARHSTERVPDGHFAGCRPATRASVYTTPLERKQTR